MGWPSQRRNKTGILAPHNHSFDTLRHILQSVGICESTLYHCPFGAADSSSRVGTRFQRLKRLLINVYGPLVRLTKNTLGVVHMHKVRETYSFHTNSLVPKLLTNVCLKSTPRLLGKHKKVEMQAASKIQKARNQRIP